MAKEVAVLGVAMTKFGRETGRPNKEMGLEVGQRALKDAGVDYRDVQVGFCSHCYGMIGTGAEVFGQLGITGIPITNVEVACASYTRGVVLAADLIAAGAYDVAMVIGIEKMPRGLAPLRGDLNDFPYESRLGLFVAPSLYAMKTKRHMHLYGTTREHFAQAAVKAHRNSSLNPNATYQEVYTLEQVLKSRLISDPITLYMCSANADGATATVLCSKKKAKQYTSRPVILASWAAGSPVYAGGEPTLAEADEAGLAKKAYEIAGLGPEDVDVVQLHDAFSPGEIFLIEEMGFCARGEGGPFVWEGNTEITGKLPVNTDGGLVSCGHPVGATGGRMIAELVWQLRGQAGPRQVKNPKVAMLHNEGGGGANEMILKV